MKSHLRTIVAAIALLAGGMALGQSTLTLPNNSAGSPLDTPPQLTQPSKGMPTSTDSSLSAFDKLDWEHRGYVTRSDVNQLPGPVSGFDQADRNRDGHLNMDEFQRFWQGYESPAGQ